MRLLKFKLLLFLLTTTTFLQAQTVTQVEWWFDNDYSSAVTESAHGNDFVWRKDMPTNSLEPGFHWLNLRFKDDKGYWSGITSHYFLKLDGIHGNVISHFEYWFGEDMTQSHSIPLSTVDLSSSGEIAIVLNLDMETVPNGLHQLNFRVGYVNGVHSAISTSFFYKCDNTITSATTVFEYWIDDDFGNRAQKTFINMDGLNTLDLDLSGFKEEGIHRLNYRIGNTNGAFGNIYTHHFFNNRSGANVLEWTFDDNPTVYTRPLSKLQDDVIFDLPANHLTNGVHSVHFRTGHQNGSYSVPFTAHFVKGVNPYAPTVDPNGEQLISEYLYWFDSEFGTGVTESIQPVKTYSMETDVEVPEHLGRGNHLFHIKFKDTYGQWGETVTEPFIKMAGQVTSARVKNLEPNVNPNGYYIKRLATVYRYYRILDDLGKPVEGAELGYIVGDATFYTKPSDADGLVTIEFQTWGNDVNTENDDYVKDGINGNNRIFFKDLRMADTKMPIKVIETDFNFANLVVFDYKFDENEMALELEGKVNGNLPVTSWEDIVLNISNKAKLSFISKYQDNKLGKRELSENKYAFQNSFSRSVGVELKTPTPVISVSGSSEAGIISKFKMESEKTSYLRTAYDLLCGVWEYSGNTDTKLFAIVKAIGNYLDDPPEIKMEGSEGIIIDGTIALNLDVNMGGIPDEVLPIKIEFETKMGTKGTYEFGNTSTRTGILGRPHTYSDFIKNEMKGSFDVSASIDFGSYAAVDGLHFGAGVETAETSGLEIEREMNANYAPKEGSITTTQGSSFDMYVEFRTAALPWLPEFHVQTGKEYSSKYTFGKDILDRQMYFPINDPLWNYLNGKTESSFTVLGLGNADKIMPSLTNIYNGLSSQNPLLYPFVNNNFSLKTSKKYTAGIGVSKKIGVDIGLLGIDWSIQASAYALIESKYPLGEFYYHPTTNKMYPRVKYADIDKPEFWLSPVQMLDDLWDNCWDAIKSKAAKITLKVAEYINQAIAWISGNNEVLSNYGMLRQYARSLNHYTQLRQSKQTDKSIIEFHIPGNMQSFYNDTEVKLEWFYPGGELMGKTESQDTIVVISDLFFLRAYHKWDTLAVAPLGNFKVYATVGNDDLAFLDLNSSYPVSVYYQSLQDTTSTWQLIGSVNDSIEIDKLGMYSLGVSVNSDKEPPVIAINKEEDASTVEITITDNMAIYWKNTFVLINGIVTEYVRNGSKLLVDLDEEQAKQDIYVMVYASDLARNEIQASAVFLAPGSPVGTKPVITQTACKLYPNPTTDICYLLVPNELRNEKTAYAIVSPAGNVFHKELIRNEETTINVSHLSAGVYFIVVFNENKIIANQKLIKR